MTIMRPLPYETRAMEKKLMQLHDVEMDLSKHRITAEQARELYGFESSLDAFDRQIESAAKNGIKYIEFDFYAVNHEYRAFLIQSITERGFGIKHKPEQASRVTW